MKPNGLYKPKDLPEYTTVIGEDFGDVTRLLSKMIKNVDRPAALADLYSSSFELPWEFLK